MKTDARDFLLSTLLIGLNLAASAFALSLCWPLVTTLAGSFAQVVCALLAPATYGLCTAASLALLGRFHPLREGEYDLAHEQFTQWKVRHVVAELGKLALSLYFPVFARAAFYALFGTRVGRQVAVAGKILDPGLTVLEEGCVLGEGCIVTSHTMWGERFVMREVHVGANATVGVGCILMPGVRVGSRAVLLPGSVVKTGTVIGSGEIWGGVPASRLKGPGDHA